MSKVYSRIPEGYVCTQEAARMLGGVKKSAARALMLRRGVPWVCYRFRGGLTAKAWDEACVRQVAASRPAVVDELPRGCVSFKDAREMMGCARSTLYRYVKRGILSDLRGRVQGERGLRDASYFLREEVEQTAERFREMKRMQERQTADKARRWGKADFFGEVCRALAEELGMRCALRLAETRGEDVDEYRFAEKGSFYLAFAIDKGGNVRWGKNYALSASRLLRVCDAALAIQRTYALETMTPEAFAASELPEPSWKLRDRVRILKEMLFAEPGNGKSRMSCIGVSKHKELIMQAKTGHVFMPGFIEGNQVGFESKKSPTGTYWFTPADLREIADFAEARKEGEA